MSTDDPIPASKVSPGAVRDAFEADSPPTVGIEEEVMLLEPEALGLRPVAHEAKERVAGDPRFRLELPASQIEIATPPSESVPAAASELADARRVLATALDGLALPACAGVHPFAEALGDLNDGPRYEAIAARFGSVARRQLICGMHVHVAIRPADRALAVYNAMRAELPLITALGANGPIHEGRDTGFASVRPRLSQLLPRQGIPPAWASWEEYAGALAWGAAAGAVPDARQWWWELRLHPVLGTIEVRAPDAQTTARDAAAVAAFVHCLAAELAARADAGELAEPADTWRIAEASWAASRSGLDAVLPDVRSGRAQPAREAVVARVETLLPHATALDCEPELRRARDLAAANGAAAQREVFADAGARGLAAWLAERFAEEGEGGED